MLIKNKYIYIGAGFLLLLISYIYRFTFLWLSERFSAPDSYYSHGFLVPIITMVLIWLKKDKIKVIELSPSKAGLPIIIISLFLQVVSIILGVYMISELSLLLLLCGIILYLFGKKIIREIMFPLFFLLFMIPLPMFLINNLSFPMRIIVTKSVVFTLSKCGLPVIQKGFEIVFPNGSLTVDNPCSGLRSLITFLALSSLFAYFLKSSLIKRIFLFFMAIPIAFVSNFFRIIFLSLYAFIYGPKAVTENFIHTFSGIMVFVVGVVFLHVTKDILNEKL